MALCSFQLWRFMMVHKARKYPSIYYCNFLSPFGFLTFFSCSTCAAHHGALFCLFFHPALAHGIHSLWTFLWEWRRSLSIISIVHLMSLCHFRTFSLLARTFGMWVTRQLMRHHQKARNPPALGANKCSFICKKHVIKIIYENLFDKQSCSELFFLPLYLPNAVISNSCGV